MSLTLGPSPTPLTVNLVRGGPWWAILEQIDSAGAADDFSIGDALELRFDATVGADIVWPATIASAQASWDVSAVNVTALIAAAPRVASLWLISGGHEVPWALGRVSILNG